MMSRFFLFAFGLTAWMVLVNMSLVQGQEPAASPAPPEAAARPVVESQAAETRDDTAPQQVQDADTLPGLPATEESPSDAAANAPALPHAVRKPSDAQARGVRMDQDGFAYGYVDFVDSHSLDQLPVSGAVVTFVQQGRVIAQAKTGADGRFSVQGLSPLAVYSMFVRSDRWVCIQGTYIMPEAPVVEAAADDVPDRFVYTSLQEADERNTGQSATGDPRVHAIHVIPLDDFVAAIQMGVFGNICGGVGVGGGCAACCGPMGGGGGGGAGGLGGVGLGAAAAAAAAGAAWGAGASNEGGELASPFSP
jgi:hypothetical protein